MTEAPPLSLTYAFLRALNPNQISQIVRLYKAAEWWGNTTDDSGLLHGIVSGSRCFLTASTPDEIVGIGRGIGDGVSDAYIQDITVDSRFRGRGIGSELVTRITKRLQSDGMTWIGLIAEKGSRPFYAPLGFTSMPDAVPMIWKNNEK